MLPSSGIMANQRFFWPNVAKVAPFGAVWTPVSTVLFVSCPPNFAVFPGRGKSSKNQPSPHSSTTTVMGLATSHPMRDRPCQEFFYRDSVTAHEQGEGTFE